MQRVCFLLQVRPERLAEYEERHKDVWPEMKTALSECGWQNYSLFLRPDGLLVGYLETGDFALAKSRMQEKDVNARWQRDMAPFFAEAGGVGDGSGFQELREVFHLD